MQSIRKRISEDFALLLMLIGLPVLSISLPFLLWKIPLRIKIKTIWLASLINAKWTSIRVFPFKVFLVCYCLWCWTIDRLKCVQGGRIINAFRKSVLWNYWRSYFDMEVIHEGKKEDFDSKQIYIFGVHPHGILSAAAWGNFISRNPKALPDDLDYRVLTISMNFKIPFWREFVMGSGLVDASRKSTSFLLKNGISIVLIVGGASEALDSRPQSFDLTLENRKGFVKLALEHGASLVPVFSFGETDIFEQIVSNPPNSLVRKIQEKLKAIFGYSLPLVWGRSFFGLPHRRKITTIIGEPIRVPKKLNPTPQDINYYHQLYKQSLKEIYIKHHSNVYPKPHKALRIVDESKL
jgi:2-acylglycerol O-acyltransferase 2